MDQDPIVPGAAQNVISLPSIFLTFVSLWSFMVLAESISAGILGLVPAVSSMQAEHRVLLNSVFLALS